MPGCGCQSEDRWECEKRRTGGINSGVECFCPCHDRETLLQDEESEDHEDERVDGCDCGDCIE